MTAAEHCGSLAEARSSLFCPLPHFPCPDRLIPLKPLHQYPSEVWGRKDGLLPNTIHAITQTRDGYLWLAAGGEFRFGVADGKGRRRAGQ